jgi:hypothetical protein
MYNVKVTFAYYPVHLALHLTRVPVGHLERLLKGEEQQTASVGFQSAKINRLNLITIFL